MFKREIISSLEKDREKFYSRIENELQSVFVDKMERELFLLAFVESINNAAEHGNKNDPEKEIKISYSFKKGFAYVSVEDEGIGFTPVFPEIKKVTGRRGHGLGFVIAGADVVFFNQKGNRISFLKGVEKAMNKPKNLEATIIMIPDGRVVIINLKTKGDNGRFVFSQGITEVFESFTEYHKFYFDLKNVPILISQDWGAIFAEAEKKDITLIHLFNASGAVAEAAKQLGIGEKKDEYNKIKVHLDDKEVQKILENI